MLEHSTTSITSYFVRQEWEKFSHFKWWHSATLTCFFSSLPSQARLRRRLRRPLCVREDEEVPVVCRGGGARQSKHLRHTFLLGSLAKKHRWTKITRWVCLSFIPTLYQVLTLSVVFKPAGLNLIASRAHVFSVSLVVRILKLMVTWLVCDNGRGASGCCVAQCSKANQDVFWANQNLPEGADQ